MRPHPWRLGTANGADTASRALVKAAGESSKGVGAARRGSGTVAVFDPPPGGLKEDPREPKAQAVGGLLEGPRQFCSSHSPFCFDDGGETFQLDSVVPRMTALLRQKRVSLIGTLARCGPGRYSRAFWAVRSSLWTRRRTRTQAVGAAARAGPQCDNRRPPHKSEQSRICATAWGAAGSGTRHRAATRCPDCHDRRRHRHRVHGNGAKSRRRTPRRHQQRVVVGAEPSDNPLGADA